MLYSMVVMGVYLDHELLWGISLEVGVLPRQALLALEFLHTFLVGVRQNLFKYPCECSSESIRTCTDRLERGCPAAQQTLRHTHMRVVLQRAVFPHLSCRHFQPADELLRVIMRCDRLGSQRSHAFVGRRPRQGALYAQYVVVKQRGLVHVR